MKIRFARHTNNLTDLEKFYTQILSIEKLGGFQNHNNYDGIFLGKPNQDSHLEFTKSVEKVIFNFGDEDYLVFYPETKTEYQTIINNIIKNKINFTTSKNPFWNENGKIIHDPDGFSIIISNLKAL